LRLFERCERAHSRFCQPVRLQGIPAGHEGRFHAVDDHAGAATAVWFLVLAAVCWLRQDAPASAWCWWLQPARGSIWNLLILAPAGLAAGLAGSDPSDPQKGRWGGRAIAGGYVLLAAVTPVEGDSKYFRVRLWVRPIEPSATVTGRVTFYLHPTFINPVVPVEPERGIAALERLAWGAFTVGAETHDGTKLELDVSEPIDFPPEFRSR